MPAVPATFGAPVVGVPSTEVAIVDARKAPTTATVLVFVGQYLRGKVALLMGNKGRKSDDDDEEEPCSRAAQAAAAAGAGAVAVLFVHEGGRIDTELPSTFGLANREDLDENFNTTTTPAFHFVHAGGECNSKDHDLGSQPSAAACAAACAALPGCQFFIFGRDNKFGRCYRELTDSADCSEGFEDDSYDFYRIAAGYSPTPLAAPLLLVSRATAAAWKAADKKGDHVTVALSPPYSAPVQLGDGSPTSSLARTRCAFSFVLTPPRCTRWYLCSMATASCSSRHGTAAHRHPPPRRPLP